MKFTMEFQTVFTTIGVAGISGHRLATARIGQATASLSCAGPVDRDRRRTGMSVEQRHLPTRSAWAGAPTYVPVAIGMTGARVGIEVNADAAMGAPAVRPPYAQLRQFQDKTRVPSRSPERRRLAVA